jgi:hypothetical protein
VKLAPSVRAAACALLFTCAISRAQEAVRDEVTDEEAQTLKALPCRPTIACTAEIGLPGQFEVEAGYAARSAQSALSHSGQLLLKYTLNDWAQLQLATNNLVLVAPEGAPRSFDGVILGAKFVFWSQGTFAPMVGSSTQAFGGAAQKTFDAAVWVYASKDVGRLHADLNFALNVFDLGGARAPQGLTALAVSYALPFGLVVMTELYTAMGASDAAALDGGWLNALGWAPIDAVVFDIGGDVALYPSTRAATFFLGLTVATGGGRPALVRVTPPQHALTASAQLAR